MSADIGKVIEHASNVGNMESVPVRRRPIYLNRKVIYVLF